MKKVSRKQRRAIYWKIFRKAVKEMKIVGDHTFICNELINSLDSLRLYRRCELDYFPEFALFFKAGQNPIKNNRIRLIVLGFCVAMCDTKEFA